MPMWTIYTYLILAILCLLSFCIKKKWFYKLSPYLFWNGFIRLFMEVFQEIALHSILNLLAIDWDSPFEAVKYSNVLALIFTGLVVFVPPFLTVFYCCKIMLFHDDKF